MTAAFLQSELSSLIADSKRKHGDVRALAERSLADLKAISVTSETQLAGDLIRKPGFVDPFMLALKSSNAKLAIIGAACLQRLVASSAIARSKLPDILQAFEEAVGLGQDVQLKILQTLPFLLQLYAAELQGVTLARTLNVSADLSSSKLPVLSSTAGATFQQLVAAVFERSSSVKQGDADGAASQGLEDALAIFIDLCALLADGTSKFVHLEKLPPSAILETIESLLSQYGSSLLEDGGVRKACADYLAPGLCTLIEDSSNYGIVARAYRITLVLIARHTRKLPKTSGDLLKILLRKGDRNTSTRWKRVLSFECMRNICADFDVLRVIFETFDLREESHTPVSDMMSLLVRTSSEDPTMIGLGRQSTIPASSKAFAADSSATVDVPVVDVIHDADNAIGISTEWSTMTTPCLETFDRQSQLGVPETYTYALILSCIAGFSDGLSKIIMPLSVSSRKVIVDSGSFEVEAVDQSPAQVNPPINRQQQLINPLSRKESSKLRTVDSCTKMVESCWPAVLAICSTFLNAALDSDFYHMLIRSVQKLTQVSGVLQLSTPRDAFLTTLAKASVPGNISNMMNAYYGSKPAQQLPLEHEKVEDDAAVMSPIASTPRQSIDLSNQGLNLRNLLCLRALLNLGIALGPTLTSAAWTIILQSLQQVEALTPVGPTARILQLSGAASASSENSSANLSTEIKAVDTARRRMIESTKSFPAAAFSTFCEALWHMIAEICPETYPSSALATEFNHVKTRSTNGNLRPSTLKHRSTRSVSGAWTKTATLEVEVRFVLVMIGRLASENLQRFMHRESTVIAWNVVVGKLLVVRGNTKLLPQLRLQSAHIIDAIAVETSKRMSSADDASNADFDTVLHSAMSALRVQVEDLHEEFKLGSQCKEASINMAHSMLEALHNVVGHCGERFEKQWPHVLDTLMLVIRQAERIEPESQKLLHAATFKILQLIVSDFLSSLDAPSVRALVELFYNLSAQTSELNMALTISTLYWTIASLLIQKLPAGSVEIIETADHFDGNLNDNHLWRLLVSGLETQARDSRIEVRNAALRMLVKVLEASISAMSHEALRSCFSYVLLPLLDFYRERSRTEGIVWNDSIQKALQDIRVLALAHHEELTTPAEGFHSIWQLLVKALSSIVTLRDMSLVTAVYDLLFQLISVSRGSESKSTQVDNHPLAEPVWQLWEQSPAEVYAEVPNEDVIAAHLQLLLELLRWDASSIADLYEKGIRISQSIFTSVFASRHDQYTQDVRNMSKEQRLALSALRRLQDIFGNSSDFRKRIACDMIDMMNKLIDRTWANTGEVGNPAAARTPTAIAFVTSCTEELISSVHKLEKDMEPWAKLPLDELFKLSRKLTMTKYGGLPANNDNPLWRLACTMGVLCVATLRRTASKHMREHFEIGSVLPLTSAIIEAPNLDARPPSQCPPEETIAAEETFDMSQLRILHESLQDLVEECYNKEERVFQKSYVVLLFTYSLVAKPWYNDLTEDVSKAPLKDFTKIRLGSIKAPALPRRREIYKEVLKCLFKIVHRNTRTVINHGKSASNLACFAAPYILLRVAHSLKTFIADQPLRYLEPPDWKLQEDLHLVLREFVDLEVSDDAFYHSARHFYLEAEQVDDCDDDEVMSIGTVRPDGRTHLRLLYALMLNFETVWYEMPRLEVGAWQEDEHGKGIEACMNEWKVKVSKRWGPAF